MGCAPLYHITEYPGQILSLLPIQIHPQPRLNGTDGVKLEKLANYFKIKSEDMYHLYSFHHEEK